MPRTLAASLVILPLVLPLASGADDPNNNKDFTLSAEEKALLELTNEIRAREKLPLFKPHPLLFKAARNHSVNMATKGDMNHVLDGKNPADRVRATGYRAARLAENISWGSSSATVAELVKGWMGSEGHRKNILDPGLKEIGLGYACDGKGDIYATQVFGTSR
jgi:uncharacterized protein YkwD